MPCLRLVRFDRMGAFAYSEEEGTYAAAHYEDSIPQEVKQARLDELMSIQQGISAELSAAKIGRQMKGGKLAGRKPVKIHQQKRHACNHSAVCKHLHRMIHFLEKKQYEYGSQQIIYQRNLLYRKKPFTGFYSLE